MVLALVLLLGMVIPMALILLAVGADALVALWLGAHRAKTVWRSRMLPWIDAHVLHHHPQIIAHR